MDRYIIINGTPYICHEYDMDSFIEEYKKAKENSKSNKELQREVQVITNMYTNEQITVEAYENTTGPIYVYNFNMDEIYFKQNFSTIWKDKNINLFNNIHFLHYTNYSSYTHKSFYYV